MSKFSEPLKGKWLDSLSGNVISVASILQMMDIRLLPPGFNGGGTLEFLLILESN
jgi:hypothetical protein